MVVLLVAMLPHIAWLTQHSWHSSEVSCLQQSIAAATTPLMKGCLSEPEASCYGLLKTLKLAGMTSTRPDRQALPGLMS